jgi:exo-beta-1,3-glucanase (GH17 family)
LVTYINQVRDAIPQPVTTDDMYIPFKMDGQYLHVEPVVRAVDFLSVHVYGFIDAQWSWDWKQRAALEGPERAQAMMAAGFEYTKMAFGQVRSALTRKGLDLPLLIGEAGWKSRPTKLAAEAGEEFRAHPVNQKIFYEQLMNWVYGEDRDDSSPSGAFYFEAFDEPWKGTDDGWGLFDVDRNAKHVIACEFPDLVPDDAPDYGPDEAIYWTETVESGE